jgi:long-chain fatty acid transport protein
MVLAMAVCANAEAGYGAYLHGYGSQSSGIGGVGFSVAQDTTPLAANPALAMVLGDRWDVGLELDQADASLDIHGNLLGRAENYKSRARNFFIPQAGFSHRLSERWATGMTGFVAGFGADYPKSPYERFGGDPRVTLNLGQVGLSGVLAYALTPEQLLGFSLNLSYQSLNVEGLDAFAIASDAPDHVTNQGNDDGLGVGFTVGWHGALTDWLAAGLSYRSKTWSQRFKDYSGLLPQQGLLELPATYGGGVALTPFPRLTLVAEFQRTLYSQQRATGNGLEQLRTGEPLGSDDGPGFGWRDQDIYKFGIGYHASPRWLLRAGTSYGSAVIPPTETLLAALAPNPARRHFTLGATYLWGREWELTGALGKSIRCEQRGDNSIPLLFGGGEADVEIRAYTVNLSVGHRWSP